MREKNCQDFQSAVDDYLIRHRSIIDVLTKYQETAARVNRAFAKAITECGCIKVSAAKQNIPPDIDYRDLQKFMSSHLSGEPCEHCKEVITKELGHNLFYMAALCNLSGLQLSQIIDQECKNVSTLGFFHLS